jgi:hypothetical protein
MPIKFTPKKIKNSNCKIQANWLTFFKYTFILCVILNFRSIWMHTESMTWVSRMVKLLMGLSVVGGVIVRKKLSMPDILHSLVAMTCLVCYAGVWYLTDSLKKNSMIAMVIQLLAIVVYCLLVEDSVEDTMRKYADIVLIIAVVSLFFWVFGSLLGYIRSTGALYTTWTGNDSMKRVPSYYGVYYETQSATLFGLTANGIVRNTAIFTEAPMASMVFCIAFLSEMLMQDKVNWKRCAILAVAVLSTISTTGYTVLIIAVGLKYICTEPKTAAGRCLKMLLIPVTFLVALIGLNFLLKQKLGTGSGSTRVDDFIAGYKAWMDAPLFGNGYQNSEAYEQYMSSFRSNNLGFSNSPMLVLAYGGVYLFAPYCVAAARGLIRLAKRKLWRRIAFYIVFLYAFVITVCPFQMLTFYLFVSMARDPKETAITQRQTASLLGRRMERFEAIEA